MNEEKWYIVAAFLVLLGGLLWCIHLVSESKECASKNGVYIVNAQPFPVCLKEVTK